MVPRRLLPFRQPVSSKSRLIGITPTVCSLSLADYSSFVYNRAGKCFTLAKGGAAFDDVDWVGSVIHLRNRHRHPLRMSA